MAIVVPKIDLRTSDDVFRETSALVQRFTNWRPQPNGGSDAGEALIQIFSQMAQLVIDRLNKVPEKNFLAFLDLIGVEVRPPLPARAPLTFRLGGGRQADAFVPARTQVGSEPAEGEGEEIIFETERSLVVTRAQLSWVFVYEPNMDRYGDYTLLASGVTDGSFPAFTGNKAIEHGIYLAGGDRFALPGPKTVTVTIDSPDAPVLHKLPIVWSCWDGENWQPIAATNSLASDTRCQVVLPDFPVPVPLSVDGGEAKWLRGILDTPLASGELTVLDPIQARTQIRRENLPPDAAATQTTLHDLREPFYPFGQSEQPGIFYISVEEAFARPGAAVSIHFFLAHAGEASIDLELAWSFWDGRSWQMVGRSGPGNVSLSETDLAFSDETLGLGQEGVVRFRAPTSWESRSFAGRDQHWLRVQVSAGNYNPGGSLQAPQVRSVSTSYEWELPRIQQLTASVQVERVGLTPDQAFANTQPLDLSKDFYPFGERPRYNDTLYLACEEAFANAGALVTIEVTLSNPSSGGAGNSPIPPVGSKGVVIAWESWNGQTWQELGRSTKPEDGAGSEFDDKTLGFTQTGQTVTFRLPPEMVPGTVNGVEGYWIRARIVEGNYGSAATYLQVSHTYQLPSGGESSFNVYEPIDADFAPPSVAALSLGYQLGAGSEPGVPPISLKTSNDFLYEDVTERNYKADSYWLPFTPPKELRPALHLGFDMPFANRSTALFAQVELPLYNPGTETAASPAETHDTARVFWEYTSPSGWTHLGANDETNALVESGLVSFIGPADFQASTGFGKDGWWLRARWDQGEFRTAPLLRRVLTNTMWASNTVTAPDEVLGSSNTDPSQVFHIARTPVLLGQVIEVKETSSADSNAAENSTGVNGGTAVYDDNGRAVAYWVPWQAVPDFHGSGPRDRHYVIDHLAGEVLFGDGLQGMIPPQGRNNIRSSLSRSGGGARGNRPAGTITQLKSAVPYVDGVTNYHAASGGGDQETLDQARERGPRTLRHRGRAVTGQDFQDLAYEASPEVARAYGLVAHDGTEAGKAGVIIVPASTAPQPLPSISLTERVEDFLAARCDPTIEIHVTGPDWVRVTVHVQVVPVTLEAANALEGAIRATLELFLHPLTGGPDGTGWGFGVRPHLSGLYALIDSISGVDYVRSLVVDEEEVGRVRPDCYLLFSGAHTIELVSPSQGG